MSEATAFLNTPRSEKRTEIPAPITVHTLPAAKGAVPKEHAHLRDADAVLVKDRARLRADAYSLTALWPATEAALPYDPRILTQLIRQGGLAVAHADYGVPLTHQTLLYHLNYHVAPGFQVPRDRPSPLTVEVLVSDTTHRRTNAGALDMNISILDNGVPVAWSETRFGWISPAAYRRLRGDRHTVDWAAWDVPPPVDPASVGRTDPADVTLSPTGLPNRWQLRNNTANTLLFDHPVDHVPGLALIEAAHQAAYALGSTAYFEPTGVTSDFTQYVEFDAPCWIEAELISAPDAPADTVRVTGVQNEQRAFQVELTGSYR
ncbi:ScbA/BarX family gamma-butyrolactone biosynthesis protein [Streptomyces cyaneofuscatus]|uniref:ScbA/BarX family gamma-butyrolactone biosynthesis protein n=1 Tax=Streptomyces cyaneofuscatus TaxID=66883 RepID=UPI003446F87F